MLAGLIAVAALAASTHTASIPAPDGTIDGCYSTLSHALFVRDSDGSCPLLTEPLNWNQTGPQGPAGPTGATGATGATGPQGPVGPAGTGSGVANVETIYNGIPLGNNPSGYTESSLNVSCPSGYLAASGGEYFTEGNTHSEISNNPILESYPTGSSPLIDDGTTREANNYATGWGSTVVLPPGNYSGQTLYVYVQCIPVSG
jgi:hypothetical protein